MQTIKIKGEVNDKHCLVAAVPDTIPAGAVEILMLVPSKIEDDVDQAWMTGVAHEWHDDLADARQDIYTLADGVPLDEPR